MTYPMLKNVVGSVVAYELAAEAARRTNDLMVNMGQWESTRDTILIDLMVDYFLTHNRYE